MTIRKVPSNFKYIKNIEKKYVCMGNAWTCDKQNKKHHGLSLIQSYQHTSILHTSKYMKIPLKCKWNAMYEVLNTFKWKPKPKFHSTLSNFEKPQNFQKIPKHRYQKHECMKCKRIEAYHVKKSLVKLEETLRKRLGVKKRVFGRWTGADRSREIEEMRDGSRRM